MSSPIWPGVRVVRGPDWNWGDQDGGEGFAGTLVESTKRPAPEGTVMVRWDVGKLSNYRIGHMGAFDLRIIDNAPIGVRHEGKECKSCLKDSSVPEEEARRGVAGILWCCGTCTGVQLCTFHYMNDKHDSSHPFLRLDNPSADKHAFMAVMVPPRKGSRKVALKGIFAGAKVQRSSDWTWEDQDGGPGKHGKVSRIQDWDKDSARSVATVTWSATNLTNVYRVGHRGKIDLQVASAASNGNIYIDHLPVVGKQHALSVGGGGGAVFEQRPNAPFQASPPLLCRSSASAAIPPDPTIHVRPSPSFQLGDKVQVVVSRAELEALQNQHGGYNPKMLEVIDKVGYVHRITTAGDVRVQYPGIPEANFRWTINPAALGLVSFQPGDRVRLVDNIEAIKVLQVNHGGWTPDIVKAMGQVGKVLKVYSDGDVRVSMIGHEWTFNPSTLRHAEQLHDNSSPGRKPSAGGFLLQPPLPRLQIPPLPDLYQEIPDLTTTQNSNGTIKQRENELDCLIRASVKGDIRSVLSILSSTSQPSSKVVRASFQGACQAGHLEVIKELAKAFPGEVTQKSQGKTALQVACHSGFMNVVEFLLSADYNSNPHMLDAKDDEGDSALHYAAYGKRTQVIKKLVSAGADVNAVNEKYCSVLHTAIVMKDIPTVDFLLSLDNINANICDAYGDTPMHEAIVKSCPRILDRLTSHRTIDLTIVNKRGFNCFHYAALKGNCYALKKMLTAAAGSSLVNSTKDDGFSALHLASLNGHLEAVAFLLDEAGANLFSVDNRGQNTLHCAVHQGHASVVEFLIKTAESRSVLEPLVNAVDVDGETPLHIALKREGEPVTHLDPIEGQFSIKAIIHDIKSTGVIPSIIAYPVAIAAFLISKGAKITVRNKAGYAPLDFVPDINAKLFLNNYCHHQPVAVPQNVERPQSPPLSKKQERVECQICCEPMKKSLKPVRFEPCGHVIVCSDCCTRMKKCIECKSKIDKKVVMKASIVGNDDDLEDEVKSLKTLKLHDLEAKVHDWEEHYMCTICMERKKNVAFLCGHGACNVCVETLKCCHMCRGPISQKINLY